MKSATAYGAAARKVGYTGDLSELQVSHHPRTVQPAAHSTYRHRTPLGNNYETLDELTQLLFIFEHFDEIVGPADRTTAICISGRPDGPRSKAHAAISTRSPKNSSIPSSFGTLADPFLRCIGAAYNAYRAALCSAKNRTGLRASAKARVRSACSTRTPPQPSRVASSTSWWTSIRTRTSSRNSFS